MGRVLWPFARFSRCVHFEVARNILSRLGLAEVQKLMSIWATQIFVDLLMFSARLRCSWAVEIDCSWPTCSGPVAGHELNLQSRFRTDSVLTKGMQMRFSNPMEVLTAKKKWHKPFPTETLARHKTDIINCHLIATRGVGVWQNAGSQLGREGGWREDNYCNARGPKPQNQPTQGLIDWPDIPEQHTRTLGRLGWWWVTKVHLMLVSFIIFFTVNFLNH